MKKPLLLPILISLSFITVLPQQQAAAKIEPDNWVRVAPAKAALVDLMPAQRSKFSQPVKVLSDVLQQFI